MKLIKRTKSGKLRCQTSIALMVDMSQCEKPKRPKHQSHTMVPIYSLSKETSDETPSILKEEK